MGFFREDKPLFYTIYALHILHKVYKDIALMRNPGFGLIYLPAINEGAR